jgi:hypothetical protein
MEWIHTIINMKCKVRPAHTESIDFPVKLTIELGGFLHIAVCADALDANLFTEKFHLDRLITLGRP